MPTERMEPVEAPRRTPPRRRRETPAGLALLACAWATRAMAVALSALVVLDAFVSGPARVALLGPNGLATRLVPGPLSGSFVFATPFGGAFRGDFACCAIILFVIDWLCTRARASLG